MSIHKCLVQRSVSAVPRGHTYRSASLEFKVPKSTIFDKLQSQVAGQNVSVTKQGRRSALIEIKENLAVTLLIRYA